MATVNEKGESVLHAIDSAFGRDSDFAPAHRINDLGESVLHQISGGAATDEGSSGAMISPTPELGQSAYQDAKGPDSNKE